jgi:Na+-transporting NADH:ubiquinone oxidoreductase subunit A
MAQHRIRRGLDIPIVGEASGEVVDLPLPPTVAIDPRELRGFIPRLVAREGETVQRGQPILMHKFNNDVVVVAPAAGRVKEVRRGHRRVITDFVIETDGDAVVQHKTWSLADLAHISADDARAHLLAGGAWPLIRQRPLDHVADPNDKPQSILISGTETGPLQPGLEVLLSADDKDALQAAIHVLGKLTGKVFLTQPAGSSVPAYSGLTGCEVHTFSGPHPAGDPTVQVNHVDPPRGADKVWYLRAWDAVVIGKLFLTGQFDSTRVYAAVGAAVAKPRFVRTVLGAPVAHIAGETSGTDLRWIRGSVLTGARTDADGWAGYYTRAVHVIAEQADRRVLGWALPQPSLWSSYRAFLSAFVGGAKRYDMQPAIHGGHRAIVPVGAYERVVATPDLQPSFLFKSILAEDLEGSIELGLLDISEEEAALCSFICPSKLDLDIALRKGLETYAKEAT